MPPFPQEPPSTTTSRSGGSLRSPGTPQSCILQPPKQQLQVGEAKRSAFVAPKKPNAQRRLRIVEDSMDITMENEDGESSNLCYTPEALYSRIPFLKTQRGSALEALVRTAPLFPDTPLNNSDKAPPAAATTRNGGLKLQHKHKHKRRGGNYKMNLHLQKRPRLEEDEDESQSNHRAYHHKNNHNHRSMTALRSRSRCSQTSSVLPEALEAPSRCFLPDIPEKRPTSPQSCLLPGDCHDRLPMRQRTAQATAAVGYSC